ncbi:MAG: molybdenum cofactor guanylyltransferase MobA [Gammaproteobacteria bacterium]
MTELPATPVSCIVLAGGQGRRMQGQDKGLVDYRGRPLIEWVLERIRPQVDDIIISANRHAQRYSAYANHVVADERAGFTGPLAGIASCLPYCRHPQALVVACDMPRLPLDLVHCLQQSLCHHTVAVISCQHRLQLAMLLTADLQASLQQALTCAKLKLMDWVSEQDSIVVEYNDSAAFSNLNTPHDLKA